MRMRHVEFVSRSIVFVSAMTLIGLGASTVSAKDVPDSLGGNNWRWSVVILAHSRDSTRPFVSVPLPKEGKGRKAVEKLCSNLKKRLADQTSATFFDNPPFVGNCLVSILLVPRYKLHNVASSDDMRATTVANSLLRSGKVPGSEMDQSKAEDVEEFNRQVKGKSGDYAIAWINVRLQKTGRGTTSGWSMQSDYQGKINLKEFSERLVHEMRIIKSFDRDSVNSVH